jgi:hypothetical protein
VSHSKARFSVSKLQQQTLIVNSEPKQGKIPYEAERRSGRWKKEGNPEVSPKVLQRATDETHPCRLNDKG